MLFRGVADAAGSVLAEMGGTALPRLTQRSRRVVAPPCHGVASSYAARPCLILNDRIANCGPYPHLTLPKTVIAKGRTGGSA